MAKPTLIIMAAGMGSRFGGLKQIEAIASFRKVHLFVTYPNPPIHSHQSYIFLSTFC